LVEYRWSDGQNDRLPSLADDLVKRRVNVIAATGGSPAALAAKAATSVIPIVFQVGVDPIGVGLVASLSRPAGNVTGATMLAVELGPKRLELLHHLLPAAKIVGALVNPGSRSAAILMRDLNSAALALGLQMRIVHASADEDFDRVFGTLHEEKVDALVIGADPLFNSRNGRLASLAANHAIPAIYQFREFAAAGGLASYGGSLTDAYRVAGVYTGRILKGERPVDLPVQQSTKIELIINLKTANALGLTIPETLLATADEVIQ
jgi:putative tryptophan/tyrosine transport system substrate-binding protein